MGKIRKLVLTFVRQTVKSHPEFQPAGSVKPKSWYIAYDENEGDEVQVGVVYKKDRGPEGRGKWVAQSFRLGGMTFSETLKEAKAELEASTRDFYAKQAENKRLYNLRYFDPVNPDDVVFRKLKHAFSRITFYSADHKNESINFGEITKEDDDPDKCWYVHTVHHAGKGLRVKTLKRAKEIFLDELSRYRTIIT